MIKVIYWQERHEPKHEPARIATRITIDVYRGQVLRGGDLVEKKIKSDRRRSLAGYTSAHIRNRL